VRACFTLNADSKARPNCAKTAEKKNDEKTRLKSNNGWMFVFHSTAHFSPNTLNVLNMFAGPKKKFCRFFFATKNLIFIVLKFWVFLPNTLTLPYIRNANSACEKQKKTRKQ
jgi:hypothetical protein